jgi:hypothetical protein
MEIAVGFQKGKPMEQKKPGSKGGTVSMSH